MDFEDAKENIQPLATGRNASILHASLMVESAQELMAQRRELEQTIHNYDGDDPLEPWFAYISWIEQSYPSGGKESGLDEVLTKCLTRFENEERYYQDRRMIKLYMKFIDSHSHPTECYQQLFNAGIGTMVADFYICWAYHYDLCGNTRKADEIFRRGLSCRAQPLEELQEAHQHFGFYVAQRIMYQDDDDVRENTKRQFEERRLALTSLRGHRRKATVGSIRTGSAVKAYKPGTVQVAASCSSRQGNSRPQIFHDENESPNVLPSDSEALNTASEDGKSVVRSLIDAARDQENKKEPGPWNKAHDKKLGKLFGKSSKTIDLGFNIHEDVENNTNTKSLDPPITGVEILYNKPFKYPANFRSKNVPLPEWNTPVTIENEVEPHTLPEYNKCFLYPRPNMEFQLEELRAYFRLKRRGISDQFTKRFDHVWGSRDINSNVRCYPNFAKQSKPQQLNKLDYFFVPERKLEMVVCFDSVYNAEEKTEYQCEEIMAKRIKLNNTIITTADMDETMCGISEKVQRRKSFFPSRKSVAHKIRTTLNTANENFVGATVDENAMNALKEKESKETATGPSIFITPTIEVKEPSILPSASQTKPVLPFEIYEDSTTTLTQQGTKVSDCLPSTSVGSEAIETNFKFKTPALPTTARQTKLPFEVYSDQSPIENSTDIDVGIFDAEETCSTQTFNIFLKSQSVSTPKAPQKVSPRLFGTLLKKAPNSPDDVCAPGTQSTDESENIPKLSPEMIEGATEYSPLQPKQLSTILETSEHGTTQGTHTTAGTTTKSTNSSSEADGDPVRLPIPHTELDTLKEQSQESSVVPGDKTSVENPKLKSNPLSSSVCTGTIISDISTNQLPVQTNCSAINTPAAGRFQSVNSGHVVYTTEALNFSIFEDERTTNILKAKQVGNFSRLIEREDTTTTLAIRSVRFQEDKTETITKIPVIQFQEDKTETISKFLAPPSLVQFESKKMDTNPLSSAIENTTNSDDSFEFFRQTPPGKYNMKLKTDVPAYIEHIDSRSPLLSVAKRVCNKSTPVEQFKNAPSKKQQKTQALFEDEIITKPEKSSQVNSSINIGTVPKKAYTTVTRDSFMPDFSFIEDSQPQTGKDNVISASLGAKPKLCNSYLGSFSLAVDSQQKMDVPRTQEVFRNGGQKEKENSTSTGVNFNVKDSFLEKFSLVMDSQPQVSDRNSERRLEAEEHMAIDVNCLYLQNSSKIKSNICANPNNPNFEYSIVPDSQKCVSVNAKAQEAEEKIMKSVRGNSYSQDISFDAKKAHSQSTSIYKSDSLSQNRERDANLKVILENSQLKDFSVVMNSQPTETGKSVSQLKSAIKRSESMQQTKRENSNANISQHNAFLKDMESLSMQNEIFKTSREEFNKSQTQQPQMFLESFMRDFSAIQEPPKDLAQNTTAKSGNLRLTFLNDSKKKLEVPEMLLNETRSDAAQKSPIRLSFLEISRRDNIASISKDAATKKFDTKEPFFEYNAETEMFATSNSMIKNSTLLSKFELPAVQPQVKKQSLHIEPEPIEKVDEEAGNSQQLQSYEFKAPKLPDSPELRCTISKPLYEDKMQIEKIDEQNFSNSIKNSSTKMRATEYSLRAMAPDTNAKKECRPESAPFEQTRKIPTHNYFNSTDPSTGSVQIEGEPKPTIEVQSDICSPSQSMQNERIPVDICGQSKNISTEVLGKSQIGDVKEKSSVATLSKTIAQMEIDDEIEDQGKDAEMSIYYKNTPKTPIVQNHIWTDDSPSPKTPTKNKYVHAQVDLDVTNQIIGNMFLNPQGNPFNSQLQSAFLEQIEFTNYIDALSNCTLVGHVSRLQSGQIVKVDKEEFEVLKLLGEGAYGTVFSGVNHKTGNKYALKQERPPNFWEYYICLEVQSRLSIEMLPSYMNVDYSVFGNNASILISAYSPYGSLITVCNKVKKHTLKNVDEYIVMLFTCELLDIIDHLHAVGIIHADIKADNFLLMKKLEYMDTQHALQLIDFGVSIDMKLFKPGQTFNYVHNQDAFKCVEMREDKPWSYQLDLYGLAGVIHVLLFGKYMEIERAYGFWMHKTHVPRYFNKVLWDKIFKTLLNIRDCTLMPNLQQLRALLKEEIVAKEKFVIRKINDFNLALTAAK